MPVVLAPAIGLMPSPRHPPTHSNVAAYLLPRPATPILVQEFQARVKSDPDLLGEVIGLVTQYINMRKSAHDRSGRASSSFINTATAVDVVMRSCSRQVTAEHPKYDCYPPDVYLQRFGRSHEDDGKKIVTIIGYTGILVRCLAF